MATWTQGADGKWRDQFGHIRCPHGKYAYACPDCGGASLCEHGRLRHHCKTCGGAGICKHGKQFNSCVLCTPSGVVAKYRYEAKRRGYAWDITKEQALWLLHQPCVYCGKERAGGIDRAKNEYGYTVLNSVSCCKTCNMTKHAKTIKAFIVAVNQIAKYCPDYPAFKERWENIRKKLANIGEQDAAVFMDVPRVRKTRRKVTDLEGGAGSSVVPILRVPDGSDARCASLV
jgi:hypothetical protein